MFASSAFFRIFPPPRFMTIRYAGLNISDDAITVVSYEGEPGRATLAAHYLEALPEGLYEAGDIQDPSKLGEILRRVAEKERLRYVKVSVPEEKSYLFETEVPSADIRSARVNIESKLEENVPLSVGDAVFYFDIVSSPGRPLKASVSVVPRTYIEHAIALMRGAGLSPVAFETVPKAIERAIVPAFSDETLLVVHAMKKKTGIYIIASGAVSFASTIGAGADLKKEIDRVYAFWLSRGGASAIKRVILVGSAALSREGALRGAIPGAELPISLGNVWNGAFDLTKYIPPLSRDESLSYAVSAGLALPS